MQKRRLLAALLAGAMAFSLTACGSSNGDTSDSTTDSTTDSATASGASYTVGVCQLMQHVGRLGNLYDHCKRLCVLGR